MDKIEYATVVLCTEERQALIGLLVQKIAAIGEIRGALQLQTNEPQTKVRLVCTGTLVSSFLTLLHKYKCIFIIR
jgi:hypothetical protein